VARAIHKLTDRSCKAAKGPKLLSDGGGLYLNIAKSNTRSWSFIWRKGGKRNEMGLGGYPGVPLARARTLAAECRELVSAGRNPIEERRREAVPSFGDCADQFIASMESQWKNEKHRAQWRMTLETYAASIRKKSVADVTTEDVLGVLKPIWETRSETASRLRGRIERVLDFAKARGWRVGENPALWRGHLSHVLPARSKLSRGHHAAMPYQDVPAFFERLRALDSIAARALEVLILTASRSGEVREARWDEFDLDQKLWSIPGHRMKMGMPHRVPLSEAAIDILSDLEGKRISDYVFPGQKAGRPMSNMAYAMLMRRHKLGEYTVHGFRSSFRDWVGDETSYPRELAEHALAHQVGGEVERAYRRSDALERRRELMDAWAAHCGVTNEGHAHEGS
jgi:integrase